MKNILLVISLFATAANAQVFTVKSNGNIDQTSILQSAFNDPSTRTVLINSSDVVINGTLNIPQGKMIEFANGFKLKGIGTVNGGNYDEDYQQQIFDTSLTVNPHSVNQDFSVKWYGAKGNNSDAYTAIQKSINTCIKNNIRTVYIPAGGYKISKPLIIRGTSAPGTDNKRSFCTLEILGESSFWDSNMGSEISTTFNNAFAIGIQDGKGCKIRKIKIAGLFTPPRTKNSQEFFSMPFEKFTDGKSRDSRNSPYSGIVIDPFTNLPSNPLPPDGGYPSLLNYYGKSGSLQTQSGSTGTELEELSISGFVVGICSSPNGLTRNAEITIINKVQFSNCKLCISGGQDQEKEKASLGKEKQDEQKVIAGLSRQQGQIKKQQREKQRNIDRLNRQISAAIHREIEEARRKAEEEARRREAAEAAKAKAENRPVAPVTKHITKASTTSEVLNATPEAAKLSNDFLGNKGRLPWPVTNGGIIQGFGMYTSGGIRNDNKGIDIRTNDDANVRAVFSGEVNSVTNIGGTYVVLIRHGEYFTVYSNLKSVSVSGGQKVSTKQIVGTVAQDPATGMSVAHFELWKGVDAVNPAIWLMPN